MLAEKLPPPFYDGITPSFYNIKFYRSKYTTVKLYKKDVCNMSVIQKIFEVWKNTLNHPTAKLDKKRKFIISNALKMGYTLEQLCEAIKGCLQTPHNMGCNDRGQRYDGLDVISRTLIILIALFVIFIIRLFLPFTTTKLIFYQKRG